MTHWNIWIKDWIDYLNAAGRSAGTRSLRRYHVTRFSHALEVGPAGVTDDDLTAFLARDEWGPNTRRSALASVRLFFAWAHRTGRLEADPAASLLSVKGEPGRPRPCPEQFLRMAVIAAEPRERLMLALAASAGLRRAEIAAVHVEHVQRTLDGYSLRVLGKGGRVRLVPLTDELAAMILARGPGHVFPGKIDGHLSPHYVGKRVSNLLPDGWTAHTLRHRFASAAYRADRDIRAVQELLGHSSVATTQIYTAIPDDAKRRAAAAASSSMFGAA